MTQHTRATKLRLSEVMKEDTAPVDFVGSVYTCPIHPEMSRAEGGTRPKCNMHLVPEGSVGHGGHGHHAYVGDHDAVRGRAGAHDKGPAGHDAAAYTCPMRAAVRQIEPRYSPIFGDGLDLKSAALADGDPNPELAGFTRLFWVGAVLTILLLADGPPSGVAAIGAGAAIMAAVSSYCAWFGSRIDAWFDHFGGPENGTFFALSGVIRAIGGGLLYGWWIYGRGGGIGHAR